MVASPLPGNTATPRFPEAVHVKAAAENFPVASKLLPRAYRRDLMAVYGYARLVDDIGDECAPADRGPLLDRVDAELDTIYAGGTPELPVLAELAGTVRAHHIPAAPLRALVQANRQDQVVAEYADFAQLMGYCELSANPVGHLVLFIFDAATPHRVLLSDRVCGALQLIEHWQDVAEDLGNGRIYLPADDRARFGVTAADLAAPRAGDRVRALLAYETDRAAALLAAGAPIVGTLHGFARFAVAGYVAGGRAALSAIRAGDHDVLAATPRPSKAGTARELLRLLSWPARGSR